MRKGQSAILNSASIDMHVAAAKLAPSTKACFAPLSFSLLQSFLRPRHRGIALIRQKLRSLPKQFLPVRLALLIWFLCAIGCIMLCAFVPNPPRFLKTQTLVDPFQSDQSPKSRKLLQAFSIDEERIEIPLKAKGISFSSTWRWASV